MKNLMKLQIKKSESRFKQLELDNNSQIDDFSPSPRENPIRYPTATTTTKTNYAVEQKQGRFLRNPEENAS